MLVKLLAARTVDRHNPFRFAQFERGDFRALDALAVDDRGGRARLTRGYILSTGCQWRAIPPDLPPRPTLYDYFDLWAWTTRSIAPTTRFMPSAAKPTSGR